MKLATLRDGSRDGRLLVVRRDGEVGAPAPDAWPTLQRALDDWTAAEPALREIADELDRGTHDGVPVARATFTSAQRIRPMVGPSPSVRPCASKSRT